MLRQSFAFSGDPGYLESVKGALCEKRDRNICSVCEPHFLWSLPSASGVSDVFCVGVNLVWGKKVRVANMLPAVLLAVLAAYVPWSF